MSGGGVKEVPSQFLILRDILRMCGVDFLKELLELNIPLWFFNIVFSVLAKNEAETTLKKKQQELLSEGKKQGGMHASEDHLKKAKILNREVDSNSSFRNNWQNKWVTKVLSC